ncbi:MAG: hypothetical protein K5892_01050 [Acholeplasmatales bacterium]|nr:hypothetical protein [Acholeplasmatales bacterium]
MKNTSDVRKDNISMILDIVGDGEDHTVLSVSKDTGLSVATCNTLLKMLVQSKQVIGTKRQINGIGRSSIIYHINSEYYSYLNIQYFKGENKYIFTSYYLYGPMRLKKEIEINGFNLDELIGYIKSVLTEISGIALIQVSLPLSIWSDRDLIKNKIEEDIKIKTFVTNKYDFIAQGLDMEGLITIVDLKTTSPIVINIKNNYLLAGEQLKNINYDLVFGDIKESKNLARCVAIDILYTFPDKVLIIGDINIDDLLNDMKEYTESPLPKFELVDELNTTCENGMNNSAKDKLNRY